ncbi:MAG: cache domain-containing protein [Burkholderiales bacterium]|nr:cache domain-containing protein [Burkholderiales bacterium]
MIRIATRLIAGLLFGLAMSVPAWASASRAEAQSQVAAAVEHVKKVGPEQATKDFISQSQWKVKGMNVIFNDMKGVVLASSLNERLIGKQTFEMKDPSGKEFVKEFTRTAQKGEGWVDYQFINPETKKLEERSMFVRRVPGFEGYVGVAITK